MATEGRPIRPDARRQSTAPFGAAPGEGQAGVGVGLDALEDPEDPEEESEVEEVPDDSLFAPSLDGLFSLLAWPFLWPDSLRLSVR